MNEVLITDPAKKPACGCIAQLRDMLAADNGKVGTVHGNGAAIVHVKRIDFDGPVPPVVAASYCPFCGDAYE